MWHGPLACFRTKARQCRPTAATDIVHQDFHFSPASTRPASNIIHLVLRALKGAHAGIKALVVRGAEIPRH